MRYQDIINSVSEDMGIPEEVVDSAYKSYWKFIKQTIQELPLKEDINEEEFSRLRTNFNIPSLGKMVCTFDRMIGVKKRYKYIKKLKEDVKN